MRAPRRPATTPVVIAALTGAVLSVAIGVAAPAAPISGAAFWLFGLWLSWGVTAAWVLTRRVFSLPMAAVTVATLVFIVLPATGAVASGQTTIAGNDYSQGTLVALQISVLAQVAIFVGACLARVCPVEPVLPLRRRFSSARLDRAALAALGTGILGVLLFATIGRANIANFFVFGTSQGYGSFYLSAAGTKSGYFTALQLVAGLALILVALRLTSTDVRRPGYVLLIAGASTFVLLGEGGRGRFFVPLVAAGLVWFKTTGRRVPARRLAIVTAAGLLAISGVIGIARGAAGERQLSIERVLTAPFGSGSDLFSPLAGLAETVPAQVHYLDGRSYLETLVFPIPRTLWRGKPHGAISDVITTFDPGNSGLAFPESGEFYANFGLIGVGVGSLLLGLVVELLWIRLAGTRSIRETLIVSVAFAVVLEIYVRGAIAPMLVTFGGLILAALVVCRRGSVTLSVAEESFSSPQTAVARA